MSLRKTGFILTVMGLILMAAGIAGLVLNRPQDVPVPDPTPSVAAFSGVDESPNRTTYASANPGVQAPEAPAFHKVNLIKAYETKNPKTGAQADALLLKLPAVPDRKFTVLVLVETGKTLVPGAPEKLYGLQWKLEYDDGKFAKSAQRVGTGGVSAEPSDHFNARYEGLGSQAEVEFFGPPGTRYYAALLTDDTYSTLILP